MARYRRFLICSVGMIMTLTLIATPLVPQSASAQDETCDDLIEEALQVVGTVCAEMGRNEACYGHNAIDVALREDSDLKFDDSGDLVNVADLVSLQTQAADPEAGTWSIAFLSAQADLPDDSDDSVTMILLGDTKLDHDLDFDDDTTQAFILESAATETCDGAPDGLLITAPEGERARIVVNNVELTLSSTLFITAQVDSEMALQGLEGQIDVAADGQTESITAGFFTTVPLDGHLPDGPPTPPEPIPLGDEFPLPIQISLVDALGGRATSSTTSTTTALPQTYSDDFVTFSYPDGWGAIRIENWVEFSNNPDLVTIRPAPGTNTIIPPGSLTGIVLSASDFSDGATTGDGAIRAFAGGIFFEQRQDWIFEGPTVITIGDIEVTKFSHQLPSTGMDNLRITNHGYRNYVIAILHVDPTVPYEEIIESMIQSIE